jgi:hypothetical protein
MCFCGVQEIRDQFKCERITAADECTSTALDDCPGGLKQFSKCSGRGVDGVDCCAEGLECVKKNNFFGQCRKVTNIPSNWDGTIQDCTE